MLAAVTEAERARIYGPPCVEARLRSCEVWGRTVRVHQLVLVHFVRTCQAADQVLADVGAFGTHRPQRIDSYNCRPIRGPRWSLHARGLAWDFFRTPPGVPPPGGVWTPDLALHPAFVATFEAAGFTWGGRWRRVDRPHIEWAGLPPR